MNKIFDIIFKDLKKEKNIYYSLIVVVVISILFGLFFITLLSASDKALLTSNINNHFDLINNGKYTINLLKNIINNNILSLIIWILGFSVIGIPIIIFILFYKGFILSFSITSLIYNFKVDGIFFSFIYVFPHSILNLIIYFILSYYSFKLSIKIIDSLINKKIFNFKFLKKYIIILLISIIFLTFSALYESYVLPYLIKMIY